MCITVSFAAAVGLYRCYYANLYSSLAAIQQGGILSRSHYASQGMHYIYCDATYKQPPSSMCLLHVEMLEIRREIPAISVAVKQHLIEGKSFNFLMQ